MFVIAQLSCYGEAAAVCPFIPRRHMFQSLEIWYDPLVTWLQKRQNVVRMQLLALSVARQSRDYC